MGLMDKWMLSCAQTATLIEKRNLTGLNLTERFKLRMHSKMCAVCLRYNEQQKWIDDALKNLAEQPLDAQKAEALKERIHQAVDNG